MSSSRIEWIDAFRGTGMCCVILGHMTIPYVVAQAIFSFHMPLFFFASGYLYSGGYGKSYVLKKVDSLMVPFFVYGILGLGVRNLGVGDVNWSLIAVLLRGNGVGVVWFLSCLFLVELIGAFVIKHVKRMSFVAYVAIAMAGLGYWMENNGHYPIMMSRVVFQACVFWLVGHMFKEMMLLDWIDNLLSPRHALNSLRYSVCGVGIVILVIGCALFRLNSVDFGSMKTGNPILLYTTAMSFIILIALISRRLLCKVSILRFMGRNSLLFMNWHVIIPTLSLYAIRLIGIDANSSFALKCIQRGVNIVLLFGCVLLFSRYSKILSGRGSIVSHLAMFK